MAIFNIVSILASTLLFLTALVLSLIDTFSYTKNIKTSEYIKIVILIGISVIATIGANILIN